jgi:hypothetical protein
MVVDRDILFTYYVLYCSDCMSLMSSVIDGTGKAFSLLVPVPVEPVRLDLTGRLTVMSDSSFF